MQRSVLIMGQWPEDFDFEVTRAINAPEKRHVPGRDSTEDEDEKKSKEAVETAEVENDESDKELDPVGLMKAFRFAAWSSVALVGLFPLSDGSRWVTSDLKLDRGNGHSHSASLVLLFDCLRRGRIVRQVERLMRLRWVVYSKLIRVVFPFLYCSLGDCGDDLDLLLRVHSSLVSALGIQGGPCSNHNRNREGTAFFSCGALTIPLSFLFFCSCLGHLFSRERKVQGSGRNFQVVKCGFLSMSKDMYLFTPATVGGGSFVQPKFLCTSRLNLTSFLPTVLF